MLDLFQKLSRSLRIALAAALAVAVPLGQGCGPDPDPTPNTPSVQAPWLTDLQAELAYAQTDGHGSIVYVDDNTIGYAGFSQIYNHQRIIRLNQPVLQTYPLVAQKFLLFHELGHHYLDHSHTYVDCKYVEASADAYAARCLYQTDGASAVQAFLSWAAALPGDAEHPNGPETVAYLSQVLAGLQSNEPTAPEPPFPVGAPQTKGVLLIHNPFNATLGIWLNQQIYLGTLVPGGVGSVALPPGYYSVAGVNAYNTVYALGGGSVELGGTTTNY